jgi:hypothetical protein
LRMCIQKTGQTFHHHLGFLFGFMQLSSNADGVSGANLGVPRSDRARMVAIGQAYVIAPGSRQQKESKQNLTCSVQMQKWV